MWSFAAAGARLGISAMLVLGLGACQLFGGVGVVECELPKTFRLMLAAKERLNPNEAGQSLATEVRVFQLSSLGRLKTLLLDDLREDAAVALADELLAQERVTMFPGQVLEEPMDLPLNDGARYVAVVAVFRRPAGTTWRAIYEVPTKQADVCEASVGILLSYELDGYQISGGQEAFPKP